MRRNVFLFLALFLSLFLAGALYAAGSGGGGGGSAASGSMPTATAKTALDWYNAGYDASQAEKYQEGVRDFRKAVSLNRDYAEAYNMLGYCLRRLGNIKESITDYKKALALKPDFPEAREYYGEAQLQDGNLAGAMEQYNILQQSGSEQARDLAVKIEEYKSSHQL
jgi:tetratricopeptide (TPR) repeat protein